MKNKFLVSLVVMASYFIIAVASSGGNDKDSKEKNEKKIASFLDTLPQSQKDFLAIEMKYDTIFDNCKNDLQFSSKSDDKDKELKDLFKKEEFRSMEVKNWRGVVEKVLSINGDAGIKIHVMYEPEHTITSPGFYLTSEAILEEDNQMGKGSIGKSSPLFKQIVDLQEGSEIEFSGKFYKSWFANRFLYTNTEYVNLEQEYLFKVTELKVLKAK